MSYRQLKPRQVIPTKAQESKLSDRPLALYVRQSKTKQVEENTESLELQLDVQRFLNQGWNEDIITVRHEGGGKKGVSGTLRIDQRAELQETMIEAKAGIIKAIGAYSVSRLFRDKYGVQSGTFMEIILMKS